MRGGRLIRGGCSRKPLVFQCTRCVFFSVSGGRGAFGTVFRKKPPRGGRAALKSTRVEGNTAGSGDVSMAWVMPQ